jgi:hypothetical protein
MFEPPSGLPSRFSLWHAAVLRPGRGAMFKAYVNPEVRGVAASRELTRQALEALGVAPAWSFIERRLRDATRILYLSTDLEKPRDARIKVYQTATDASAVEELVRGSANTPPGLATSWLRGLTLGEGPYDARPILVCHSWRQRGTAPEATVHIPIRNYAPSDGEALERTLGKGLRRLALHLRDDDRFIESFGATTLQGQRARLLHQHPRPLLAEIAERADGGAGHCEGA